MPDETRAPIAVRITRPYASDEEFLASEVETLTRTSVVLLGAPQKPQGVVLRFELALSTGQPLLRGEGRVVGYRMAQGSDESALTLRFTRLDARSKALVDRAAALRDAKGRPPGSPSSASDVNNAPITPTGAFPPPPAPPTPSSYSRPRDARPRPPRSETSPSSARTLLGVAPSGALAFPDDAEDRTVPPTAQSFSGTAGGMRGGAEAPRPSSFPPPPYPPPPLARTPASSPTPTPVPTPPPTPPPSSPLRTVIAPLAAPMGALPFPAPPTEPIDVGHGLPPIAEASHPMSASGDEEVAPPTVIPSSTRQTTPPDAAPDSIPIDVQPPESAPPDSVAPESPPPDSHPTVSMTPRQAAAAIAQVALARPAPPAPPMIVQAPPRADSLGAPANRDELLERLRARMRAIPPDRVGEILQRRA